MQHVNVLDLAVFPAISCLHIHLMRSLRGVQVVKEDKISKITAKVWEDPPS